MDGRVDQYIDEWRTGGWIDKGIMDAVMVMDGCFDGWLLWLEFLRLMG